MIIQKNNIIGSEYWCNSYDKTFNKIQEESYVPLMWRSRSLENINDILQPTNKYCFYFSNKPKLIKQKNKFLLRQKTHAEIWVDVKKNGIYALDKTMQRQFYPSENKFDLGENCLNACYKFYTPWVINKDIELNILSVKNSNFVLNTKSIKFLKFDNQSQISPPWIDFSFKITDKIITDKYEIIEQNTPMFDIIIDNDELLLELINYYEK
jgi:hypothetical protein